MTKAGQFYLLADRLKAAGWCVTLGEIRRGQTWRSRSPAERLLWEDRRRATCCEVPGYCRRRLLYGTENGVALQRM